MPGSTVKAMPGARISSGRGRGKVEPRVVGFQSDAVTESVGEAFAMACLGDDFASGLIDFVSVGAGPHLCDGGFLGLAHGLIDVLLLLASFAKGNGAGHIGGVALIDDTEVEKEHLVGPNYCLVWKVVDFPSVPTRGDDGGEGVTVHFFALGDFGEDDALDGALAEARGDLRKNRVEDVFVDALRLNEEFDFGGGLETANVLDGCARSDFFGRELLGESCELVVSEGQVDPDERSFGRKSFYNVFNWSWRGAELELRRGGLCLFASPRESAEGGVEHRGLGCEEKSVGLSLESGGVATLG